MKLSISYGLLFMKSNIEMVPMKEVYENRRNKEWRHLPIEVASRMTVDTFKKNSLLSICPVLLKVCTVTLKALLLFN